MKFIVGCYRLRHLRLRRRLLLRNRLRRKSSPSNSNTASEVAPESGCNDSDCEDCSPNVADPRLLLVTAPPPSSIE